MEVLKTKKLLKINHKDCSNCGSLLVKTHSRRNLRDLQENYFIDSEIGRCTNKNCACYGLRLYPTTYKNLIYPKSDYSLSVYALIGYHRLNESKSVSQIRKYIEKTYPNLIGITDRSIENIYKRVQVCLRQNQKDKEYLKKVLAKKGVSQLCLTLDGIAPERGNAILYVIREVHSQEILYGRYLEHSDIVHLKSDLFEPLKEFLKELDIPIGGWVCDKQNGFIPAIEAIFPEVPIHLCQSHFLKSMAKPAKTADSELAKEVKKKLRPLKQIEKDLQSEELLKEHPLTVKEKQSISTLCLLPRAWISRSISVEYQFRGVQMYEQFARAIKTIKKMEKKHEHPLLSRLKAMFLDSLEGKKSTYEDLKKTGRFLGQLTDVLYGKKQKVPKQKQLTRFSHEHRKQHTAVEIEKQVDQLIEDFKQSTKKRSPLCRKIIRNFETTYANWKPNIFTCYTHDFIPNDNNSLESNHNKVKRVIRKITGNKSTAQPLLVYGEEIIFCQSYYDKEEEDFLFALSEVDFEQVATRQQQLKKEQKRRGAKIRVINQTKKVLKEVLDNW